MVNIETSHGKNQDDDPVEDIYERRRRDREEYMTQLNKWLDDARLWHLNMFAALPQTNSISNDPSQQQLYRNIAHANFWQGFLRHDFNNAFNNTNVPAPPSQTNHTSLPNHPPETYEFVIPPLWKRAAAEMMDFLILFLFKMGLTFLLLESFDIIDMGLYGFESFQKNLENPYVAVPMAMELLALELLHRVIVCVYETFFLYGNYCATPGKRYMGLMVITADSISPVPGRAYETVTAFGATTIGLQKSFARACLKNLFVGLFLPLCVAFYVFPFNRTSYDMMSNCIVVEYNHEFIAYNAM